MNYKIEKIDIRQSLKKRELGTKKPAKRRAFLKS